MKEIIRNSYYLFLMGVLLFYSCASTSNQQEPIDYRTQLANLKAILVNNPRDAEAMRDVGVSRVVFISSGAIYGEQTIQPLKEVAIPNPGSPYAVSKLASEYYVHTIGRLWGIDTICLRVFNAYGPGQGLPVAHPPVIPNFLRQAVKSGTIVIHGDGKQTRDYVFVEDVVQAMVSAGLIPGINSLSINVGSGVETSLRNLVQMILHLTDSRAEVIYNPRSDPGVPRMCADLCRANDTLGYQPRVTLEQGLRLTLERDKRFQTRITTP